MSRTSARKLMDRFRRREAMRAERDRREQFGPPLPTAIARAPDHVGLKFFYWDSDCEAGIEDRDQTPPPPKPPSPPPQSEYGPVGSSKWKDKIDRAISRIEPKVPIGTYNFQHPLPYGYAGKKSKGRGRAKPRAYKGRLRDTATGKFVSRESIEKTLDL